MKNSQILDIRYYQKLPKDISDYYHIFNSHNIQHFEALKRYLVKTRFVKGDILEFRVDRGKSLIIICYLIKELKLNKEFIAMDSFLGFDFISSKDSSYKKTKVGEWSCSPNQNLKYNKTFIQKILKKHIYKNNFKKPDLIKGYVGLKLSKLIKKIKKISFINLDLDLYSGHKNVLSYCWDKLSVNGMIYFDDIIPSLRNAPFPGALLAYKEFFKNNKKQIKEYICPQRKNLIVKKIK